MVTSDGERTAIRSGDKLYWNKKDGYFILVRENSTLSKEEGTSKLNASFIKSDGDFVTFVSTLSEMLGFGRNLMERTPTGLICEFY